MNPLTLTAEEVQRALKDRKVTLVRPIDITPADGYQYGGINAYDEHIFYGLDENDKRIEFGDGALKKSPFSAIGTEFFGQEVWGLQGTGYSRGNISGPEYWVDICYQATDPNFEGWVQKWVDHQTHFKYEKIFSDEHERVWYPQKDMPQEFSRLTLSHTGTEVKQEDGIWKWIGNFEVKE